jgi:hypothetical protein
MDRLSETFCGLSARARKESHSEFDRKSRSAGGDTAS